MRLFIAINFNEQVINELKTISKKFQEKACQGNFTRPENFHLTLVFLGEIEPERIEAIKQAMNRVKVKPFKLTMNGLGRFKRRGGDIYWIGVAKNKPLLDLYQILTQRLIQKGFVLEKREFKPHLTIGRQVMTAEGFNSEEFSEEFKPLSQSIDKISLMLSERINGQMVYTELYSKYL